VTLERDPSPLVYPRHGVVTPHTWLPLSLLWGRWSNLFRAPCDPCDPCDLRPLADQPRSTGPGGEMLSRRIHPEELS